MSTHTEVFIFVDALGWKIADERGFLAGELPHRRKVTMQFGYSCSAIPTILTGRPPAEHGHLGLFVYDPARSPFGLFHCLSRLLHPRSFWDRGRVRSRLSRLLAKLYGFSGYFQLYRMPFEHLPDMDYAEKQDLFAPGGLAPMRNLHDLLAATPLAFHISDWRRGDAENFAAGRTAIESGKGDFLFLYAAGLDAILHDGVGDPGSVGRGLAFYEDQIRQTLAACRRHCRSWRVTVISDHGMTPCRGVLDLRPVLRATGLQRGRDYAACFDSTMLRFYFLRREAEGILRRALAAYGASGRWLSREDELRYGIYRTDRRFGDAIFLLHPGIQLAPSDMGDAPLAGMHGFAPEDPDSDAAILSSGPIPGYVRQVADYFRLMEERIRRLQEGGS